MLLPPIRGRAASRLASVAAASAVVAGVAVLWLRFNHAPSETPPRPVFDDLLNYYYPMAEYVGGRLASGALPLWNPYACSGVPLLATLQVAVLYPGTWLSALVPAHLALPWLMFGECVLAGLFSVALLRAWGRSHLAAASGGLVTVFACVLGQTLWPPQVSTICWLPWLMFCVEHVVRRGRALAWLGLVAGVALQCLAGFPQYLFYSYLLIGPFAALRLLELHATGATRAALSRAALLLAAVGLGAGLAAVQLLPGLELVAQSDRAGALLPAEVHYLNRAFSHTLPDVLRTGFDASPKVITHDLRDGAGYLGAATWLMLWLGVAATLRTPLTWLLLAVGAAALVMADGYLGVVPGLYRAVAALPVFGSLRTPERLRVVAFFCAVLLASAGFDQLGRDHPPSRRRRLEVVLALGAGVAFVGMAAVSGVAATWRVVGAAALAAFLLRGPSPRASVAAQAALFALLLLDLALATQPYGWLRRIPREASATYYATDAQGRALEVPAGLLERVRRESGLARVEPMGLMPWVASGPAHALYRVSCYGPLVPAQWTELHRVLTGEYSLGVTLHDLRLGEAGAFFEVAGVARFVVSDRRAARVVEAPRPPLPRAYFVERHAQVEQSEAFWEIRQRGLDFHSEVLLERDPGLPAARGPAPPALAASIVDYEPERVEVDVHAPHDGLLVLSDTDYPGWRASVDGEPARILRANGLYRAVRVDQGDHRVTFEFRPASLRNGALLSAASGLAAAAVGLALRRRARR